MTATLFLLKPGFADPAYPGKSFYCWHCALLEGILTSFPDCAARLTVRRIDWPRPRREVVDRIGEANQSLPVLVFEDGSFLNDKDEILTALSDRYGFPMPHP